MARFYSKPYILTILFLFVVLFAPAQSPSFWEEDFSAGIPTGWVTNDLTGGGAFWTWCNDPDISGSEGCPSHFATQPNFQNPFNATTANNGFMTMDSDSYGSGQHLSTLTSPPINCEDLQSVFIRFESHIGVFNTKPDTSAFLRVSTDLANWTNFVPFPDLILSVSPFTGERRWSHNPTVSIFDLSAVAAGSSTVYLQWYWNGEFEYHWNLDDITLHEEDPNFKNDLRVSKDFFAIAPNYATPVSQIERFGFLADIENIGVLEQPNVRLSITIKDESNNQVVYADTIDYGNIAPDSLAENMLFPDDGFLAESMVASYIGTYQVWSDSIDAKPADNFQTFRFEITDSIFAKENEFTEFLTPNTNEWSPNEAYNWKFGNYYHLVNGEGFYATDASFALYNPLGEFDITGEAVTLYLYKWVESEEPDGLVQEEERTYLGIANYEITTSTSFSEIITIPLLNFNGEEEPIELEDNGHYILMIEYEASALNKQLPIPSNDQINYGAQIFRSQELNMPRYGPIYGLGSNTTFNTVGFGLNTTPTARLHISDGMTPINLLTQTPPKLAIYPNPSSGQINVIFELEAIAQNVQLQVKDLNGQTVFSKDFKQLKNLKSDFDLQHLSNGIYCLHLKTEKGTAVKKFVIVK